jgi:hypothetical protein
VAIGALTVGALSTTACGSDPGSAFSDDPESSSGETSSGRGGTSGQLGPGESCDSLECRRVTCGDPNVTTTISGIVTAPNGTLPLYNAIVYVPGEALEPLADGATCDRCGSVSGKPLSATVTGADGKFVLKNVPAGKNVPVVIQVGKWRRELTVDNVAECSDNPIADLDKTRLPRNQSEGHMPKIAVTTGRCDQLACLLPKLGIDASEYTPSNGPGRLHVYRGSAHPTNNPIAAPAPSGSLDAATLWSDASKLKQYDMVMLSCECGEHNETKPDSSKQAMYDYAAAGGRIFASHFHYAWTQTGPLKGTAQWLGGSNDGSNSSPPFFVDTGFPKGAALADWLVNVGATSTHGEIPISQPRQDVGVVVSPTQRWVFEKKWLVNNVVPDPTMPEATKYLSVNTPVGQPVENQCGKFVFADMHLYGGDVQPNDGTALPDDAFPGSCSKDLTPEEKALAFLFFDLSSCVQDDTQPPSAPIK